jgi:hypothetical protein
VRHGPADCRDASSVEALLQERGLRILKVEEESRGRQGSKRLTLLWTGDGGSLRFRAKWRALSTSHGLNDPRRELGAYAFQKRFLQAEDFVTPPTVAHCFDIEHYRTLVDAGEEPSFPGTSCVFGTLGYWLEDTFSVEQAYAYGRLPSPELLNPVAFARVPSYRRSISNANLLTSLISAGDTHRFQFVVAGDARAPHVYVVDHTISFSFFRNPKLGLDEYWSIILVPALPRDSIERLRSLSMQDFDQLSVIEQFEIQGGLLSPTAPGPVTGSPDVGLRWTGHELQVGLTTQEIDLLWNRTQDLLERIDRGEIVLF